MKPTGVEKLAENAKEVRGIPLLSLIKVRGIVWNRCDDVVTLSWCRLRPLLANHGIASRERMLHKSRWRMQAICSGAWGAYKGQVSHIGKRCDRRFWPARAARDSNECAHVQWVAPSAPADWCFVLSPDAKRRCRRQAVEEGSCSGKHASNPTRHHCHTDK